MGAPSKTMSGQITRQITRRRSSIRAPWASIFAQASDKFTVHAFRCKVLRELKKIKLAWRSLNRQKPREGSGEGGARKSRAAKAGDWLEKTRQDEDQRRLAGQVETLTGGRRLAAEEPSRTVGSLALPPSAALPAPRRRQSVRGGERSLSGTDHCVQHHVGALQDFVKPLKPRGLGRHSGLLLSTIR